MDTLVSKHQIKHQVVITSLRLVGDMFMLNVSNPVQVGIPHLSTISGGGLPTTYKAVQFHLHWGKNGGPGSEHTIDGEQYPMEVPEPYTKHTLPVSNTLDLQVCMSFT